MNLFKKYYEPTPRNFRKLGDAFLGISTFITGSAISTNNHILAYSALALGVFGKFLTNFFMEKNKF